MPVCPILSVTLVYCDQTVGWIKVKLGTKVGLGPGHIVLNTNPAISPQTGHRRLLSAQTPGTSDDDRNTTSGSTGSEHSTLKVTGSTFLPSRDIRIVCRRVQTAVFPVSVKPEVVVCRPEVVLRPPYRAVTCISHSVMQLLSL